MFSEVASAVFAILLAMQAPTTAADNSKGGASSKLVASPEVKAQPASEDGDIQAELLHVRRIFVDSFGDDPISKQVQAMVVSSLTDSKKFIVTENKDKADAILKGSGGEKTSHEYHATSEGTAAGGVSPSLGVGAAIEDSSASTETLNDATVSLRLVNKDGDVIWATTQESKGAKYKGASADVAEKVVKQLLRDRERLEKKAAAKTQDN